MILKFPMTILYIDRKYGDNRTAQCNNPEAPFKSLGAAILVSRQGDILINYGNLPHLPQFYYQLIKDKSLVIK